MRQEFSAKTKLAALECSNGMCELCDAKLRPGRWQCDHIIPCGLGGDNSLDNAQTICAGCHADKTGRRDVPAIAWAKRICRRAIGIRKRRTIRAWRRFDGSPVYARD